MTHDPPCQFVPSCDTDSGNVAYLGTMENIHMWRMRQSKGIGFATHVKKCGGVPVPVEYIQYVVSKLGYARVRASRVKGPIL